MTWTPFDPLKVGDIIIKPRRKTLINRLLIKIGILKSTEIFVVKEIGQ